MELRIVQVDQVCRCRKLS